MFDITKLLIQNVDESGVQILQ